MTKKIKLYFFIIQILLSNTSFSDSLVEQKYSIFLDQLKQHILEDPLFKTEQTNGEKSQKEIICEHFLSHALKTLTQESSKKNQETYQMFLVFFRKALQSSFYQEHHSNNQKSPLVKKLEKLAFVFYTKIEMNEYQKEITKKTAFKGKLQTLSKPYKKTKEDNIHNRLASIKEQIQHLKTVWNCLKKGKTHFNLTQINRLYQSYKGNVTWSNLDIQKELGPPRIKFTGHFQEERKEPVTFIRMSTPTIGSDENSSINPEFKAYLSYLKKQKLKHSYINLQDNRKINFRSSLPLLDLIRSTGINYEFHRSHIIEALDHQPYLQNTIKTTTLGRDNSFYLQNSEFDIFDHNFHDFLQYYLALISRGENGYKIAYHNQEQADPKIMSFLSQLKSILFNKREITSSQERKIFIELSYFFIIDLIANNTTYMNITCKDGIDRAGATHTLVFVMVLIKEVLLNTITKERFETQLSQIPEILFSDALTVKQREVSMYRLKTPLKALLLFIEKVQQNPEQTQKLVSETFLTSVR